MNFSSFITKTMPVYVYKSVDVDGAPVGGTLTADTPRQARDMLRHRGLTVFTIETAKQSPTHMFWPGQKRSNQTDVTTFVRDLSTLLKAGIPLLSAMQTLSRRPRRQFKPILQDLADKISAGSSLADAMKQHPAWFDKLCVSIVHVGENTGDLDSSLKRLAEFKEKADKLRSRVITALLYPIIVCIIGSGVCMFLMTYVVPQLLDALMESGKQLPAITQVVKIISDFLVSWWWALVVGVAILVLSVRISLKNKKIRYLFHRLLLKSPIFGDLIGKENTSRMSIVLAALLRSGVPFVEAIQITKKTLRNLVFREAMDKYARAVTAGRDVAIPLEETRVFNPMVVQMLAVGQQSGELEDMLEQLAEAYDQQVQMAATRMTTILEPLLIVALAVLVGFIAFATILPILEVSNVL